MHAHNFLPAKGSLRDRPNVGVRRCSECGLTVHESDLSRDVSYESGSMHVWANGWGEISPPRLDIERRASAIQDLMGATSDPMYLDFGCGSGSMVLELSKTSVNAFGYDPDRDAILPELLEANSAVSDLEQLRAGPFSVVSLFHVVEHIYDIPKFLASIKLLLRSDGFLIIETPNARDALITKYECDEFLNFTFWSHHPNLCTNQFLDEALSDAGYAVLSSDQIQRYGINNHLHWLSEGAPGGHESWRGFIGGSADSLYADELISKGMADTIWIVASPNP